MLIIKHFGQEPHQKQEEELFIQINIMEKCTKCGMKYPHHKMSCKDPIKEYRLPTAKEFAEANQYDLEEHDESGYLGINTDYFAEK